MKFKLYFRSSVLALAGLFVAIGCKTTTPPDAPPPPTTLVSFDLKVENVMPGEATLAVKPSDNTLTYFFGAMTKADFDAIGSPSAFFEAENARVLDLAIAQQMTLAAYLQANAKTGMADIKIATPAPLTEYYAYVYALDAAGKVTSELFKVAFTSGKAVAAAPEIELTMTPGDLQGLDKDTRMTIGAKSSGVTSGKLLLAVKSQLDGALAAGLTLEDIMNDARNGTPLEAAELEALNGEGGWKFPLVRLTPSTDYTAVVKVTNAIGSTIKTISESTLANAGNNPPSLDLILSLGDLNGENKSTTMAVVIKSPGAMAGRYGLFAKSAVDAALERGITLAQLIEANGASFMDEHLLAINSADGYTISVIKLSPNTAYTFIAKVASTGGTSVKSESLTTTTGIGPMVTVSAIPGDADGANKDANLFVTIKSPDAQSGRHTLMNKAEFDAEIKKGTTPAQILSAQGIVIAADGIAALKTTAGMTHVFSSLMPSTAYKHIVELVNFNGTSYEYVDALTESSSVPESNLTFEFDITDVGSTAANLMVIPSVDNETYYYDYLEVEQYDKLSDAERIAKIIGDNGISSSSLSTGKDGIPYAGFDYLPLIASTDYYLYAFGYDEATKSATTLIKKQKFTTRPANEPSTPAYAAWLGLWTVTSTSSEKNATPISMEIEISQKVNNVSYNINGWGITSHRTKNITAALAENGGLSIKNKQAIVNTNDGILYFVGRYKNPSSDKYAMAVAPIDALIGSLSAGGQSATIVGGTFETTDSLGVVRANTITAMDYYNNKTISNGWFSYTALADYTASGNGVGPYELVKLPDVSNRAKSFKAPFSAEYKMHLAKRTHIKQAIAAKSPVAVQKVVELSPVNVVGVKVNTTLNLPGVDVVAPRFGVSKVNVTK